MPSGCLESTEDPLVSDFPVTWVDTLVEPATHGSAGQVFAVLVRANLPPVDAVCLGNLTVVGIDAAPSWRISGYGPLAADATQLPGRQPLGDRCHDYPLPTVKKLDALHPDAVQPALREDAIGGRQFEGWASWRARSPDECVLVVTATIRYVHSDAARTADPAVHQGEGRLTVPMTYVGPKALCGTGTLAPGCE